MCLILSVANTVIKIFTDTDVKHSMDFLSEICSEENNT